MGGSYVTHMLRRATIIMSNNHICVCMCAEDTVTKRYRLGCCTMARESLLALDRVWRGPLRLMALCGFVF